MVGRNWVSISYVLYMELKLILYNLYMYLNMTMGAFVV
jgi:hypothetical protein